MDYFRLENPSAISSVSGISYQRVCKEKNGDHLSITRKGRPHKVCAEYVCARPSYTRVLTLHLQIFCQSVNELRL